MLYVTGITGHSGRWFVDRLVKEGYRGKIRCVVRTNSNTKFLDNSRLDVEKVVGDLDDADFLTATMQDVKTILNIAGIFWSEKVIEAAIKNKVKWAICVHTTGRFSQYKSASQDYIRIEDGILRRRNEIDITVVRPTMIYGSSLDRNMYKLIDFLYRNRFFPMFGEGLNFMQPVHARDLGNAYYNVMVNASKTTNKEYDLPGKSPIAYIDLVRAVSKTLGKNTTIVKIPLWFSLTSAKIYNGISKRPIITVEQVLRMQEDKTFSYKLAEQDFGYDPVTFEDGIKDEVHEYLDKVKKRDQAS